MKRAIMLALSVILALAVAAPIASGQTSSQGEKNKPQGGASEERVGIQQATGEKVITSDGPLTSIAIANDLSCQVDHEGNGEGGEFFFGETSAVNTSCGTVLAVGNTTFGKEFFEDFTPVSQSDVTGSGTRRNPFKIKTVVDAGDTGLRITQTDSYVVGNDFYSTKVSVKNRGSSRQNVVLYRFGDCYLNLTDSLTRGKVVQSSLGDAPACESTNQNAPEELSLLPLSGGFTYQAGTLNATFAAPNSQAPYGNTCDSCPNEADSGVGLSWELSIARGDSKRKSHQTKVVIPVSG